MATFGGKKKKTGLYQGKAGKLAAQQDPGAYTTSLLRHGGQINDSGSDYDNWLKDPNGYSANLYSQYHSALADHGKPKQGAGERLMYSQWLKQQTGDYYKKHGNNPYVQGTLGNDAQNAYQTYFESTNPNAAYNNRAQGMGLQAANGNADFANWQQENYVPYLQTQWDAAAAANPTLTRQDWMNGRDTAAEARTLYANRAGASRAPNPYAALGGRWSMWD